MSGVVSRTSNLGNASHNVKMYRANQKVSFMNKKKLMCACFPVAVGTHHGKAGVKVSGGVLARRWVANTVILLSSTYILATYPLATPLRIYVQMHGLMGAGSWMGCLGFIFFFVFFGTCMA